MTQSGFDIELDQISLARAARGDMDACELIYRRFQKPAYSIALRICHCPELAQEVMQESFILAFKKLKQFRGDAPFWGWLRRVVVNQAISTLRRKPNLTPVEIEEHHAIAREGQEAVGISMDLEQAFNQLDYHDRTVLWLHDAEGYSHKEIAGFFGMTESFSKTRLSRARSKIRDILQGTEHVAKVRSALA